MYDRALDDVTLRTPSALFEPFGTFKVNIATNRLATGGAGAVKLVETGPDCNV